MPASLAAAVLMKEVLLFLRDCHLNGICFSDVKPANFMLSQTDDGDLIVKAVDFGCAQVCSPGQPLVARKGTPVYFAPEMFHQSYGLEADVWSAGIMLYRFVTSRFPWFDIPPSQLAPARIQSLVVAAPIPFDLPVWRYKTDACLDLVKQMLSRDVDHRISLDDALNHKWFKHHCGSLDDQTCSPEDREHFEGVAVAGNVVLAGGLAETSVPTRA